MAFQVAEINRPLTGGKWCGAGSGYAVYFSETSAIALTLGVAYSPNGLGTRPVSSFHPNSTAEVGQNLGLNLKKGPPGTSAADDFEFKIRYKFIPRSLASVR